MHLKKEARSSNKKLKLYQATERMLGSASKRKMLDQVVKKESLIKPLKK